MSLFRNHHVTVDGLDVSIDGRPLTEAGGQAVVTHGKDRDLTIPVTR